MNQTEVTHDEGVDKTYQAQGEKLLNVLQLKTLLRALKRRLLGGRFACRIKCELHFWRWGV
jgi:hypothetical protein